MLSQQPVHRPKPDSYPRHPSPPPQAVIGISELVKRRSVDPSSFDPLCQTLSRLIASQDRLVVAYAARSIKLLLLDDSLRPQATAAGVPSALASAFVARESDVECMREVLG